MKTKLLLLTSSIAILLSSCSSMMRFDKRKYMPGRYHERNSNSMSSSLKGSKSADLPLSKVVEVKPDQKQNRSGGPGDNSKQHKLKSVLGTMDKVERKDKTLFKNQIRYLTDKFDPYFSTDKPSGDDSQKGEDRSPQHALNFTLLSFFLICLTGLIGVTLFSDSLIFAAVSIAASGISYLAGFIFACIAMHKHRGEKEKYKGRGGVRFVFWLFILAIIASAITGIAIASFSVGGGLI